ncbi:MAG TPA: AbrB/MazE/SpoVT family DNA-binding domain-containing protein [Alphaproteobacteria bacterium]
MSRTKVVRWGKNLVIPVPSDVARAVSLTEGEQLDIEVHGRQMVIRRSATFARADVEAAAEEIIRERRQHPLPTAAIRKLIDVGRRPSR